MGFCVCLCVCFFNPFAALVCTISGVKDPCIFPVLNAMFFDENPFTCRCKKEGKKA